MKKLICIFLLAGLGIVNSNQAHAQGVFGVETGANFANINGTEFETDVRAGFLLGVYYKLLLANTFLYLQPELLYAQRGWKERDVTFQLNYLTVNLLVAYYFVLQGAINPFVKFGPSFGINTTAKAEFEDQEQDLEDVKSTDIGVMARAGVQVNDRVEIGARLVQGLTSVSENDNFDAKNFVFGFFIGFSF